MSEQQVDLLDLVDAYLRRTGREVNERNRLNAIYTNGSWAKRWPAYKAAQAKKKLHAERPKQTIPQQDTALVAEWLEFENKRRTEFNATLTSGVGLPKLEIGFANGQISFDNALFAARQWFKEKEEAYEDSVNANLVAKQHFINAENKRANKILHQPYPADGIGRKFLDRYDVGIITEELAAAYVRDYIDIENGPQLLRDLQRTQRDIAAMNLGTTFSDDEARRIDAFVKANNLDFLAPSYEAAFQALVAEGVIRRAPMSWPESTATKPELPEVKATTPVEARPQGRAAEQAQREKDTLRDIRATLKDYIEEVEQNDQPVPDQVVFNAYDELLKNRIPIDRSTVRKAIFYSWLRQGRKPAGFSDDEIESFTDRNAMQQVSAEEYKRQMALYGDVRLSRVPNKETALLEQIVKNTTRKG